MIPKRFSILYSVIVMVQMPPLFFMFPDGFSQNAFLQEILCMSVQLLIGFTSFVGAAAIEAFIYRLRPYLTADCALPPGRYLSAWADFWYSEKTRKQLFDPLQADLYHEYFAALAHGRELKALRIHLTYVLAFWGTAVSHATTSAIARQILRVIAGK